MTAAWRHLPPPARAIAVGTAAAVAAAGERDRDAFDTAVLSLATVEGSGLVLGAVVRLLVEELHPDGVDGDDIRRILDRCVPAAAGWQPPVDQHTMLLLLAGALGIHDQDEESAPPAPVVLTRHAVLLTADLLAAGDRPLDPYLGAAFAEIQRTELQD